MENKKEIGYTALDTKILAIAVQGGMGTDWSAYICIVEGQNHHREALTAWRDGSKLRYEVARVLFPHWDKRYTWRY